MDPIKCANLLLCTVKQIASDRPNTLMVISPELSLTFQASDEADLREWIAVVEAGIGWQLTKKQLDSAEQALTSVRYYIFLNLGTRFFPLDIYSYILCSFRKKINFHIYENFVKLKPIGFARIVELQVCASPKYILLKLCRFIFSDRLLFFLC